MRRWLILALLLTSPAGAAEWRGIDLSDQYKALLDVSSIRIQGPIRHAWEKNESITGVCEQGRRCSYYLAYVAVNCADGSFRFEEAFTFFADGHSAPDGPQEPDRAWRLAVPDSLQDAILKAICDAK
jgi:formylmethanofuran dehydrogenase subunit B